MVDQQILIKPFLFSRGKKAFCQLFQFCLIYRYYYIHYCGVFGSGSKNYAFHFSSSPHFSVARGATVRCSHKITTAVTNIHICFHFIRINQFPSMAFCQMKNERCSNWRATHSASLEKHLNLTNGIAFVC